MNNQASETPSLSKAFANLIDGMLSVAIARTPALDEPELRPIQQKKQAIIQAVDGLFPALPFERFAIYQNRTVWAFMILCLALGGVLFRVFPVPLVRHLVLGYIFALLASWSVYGTTLLLRRSTWTPFSLPAVASGLTGFAIVFSWWLSPVAPFQPESLVSSTLSTASPTDTNSSAVSLTGTALLAPNEHLWVLVGRPHAWRPVDAAVVDPKSGTWNVGPIRLADLRAIGCQAKVAVVTVDSETNDQLRERISEQGGSRSQAFIDLPKKAEIKKLYTVDTSPNCRNLTEAIPQRKNQNEKTRTVRKKIELQPRGHGGGNWPLSLDFSPSQSPGYIALMKQTMETASQLIAQDQADVTAYKERGYAKSALGDQDGAEDDFDHSIALRGDPDAFNGRGLARLRKGRLEEAISDFSAAVDLDPSDSSFAANLQFAEGIRADSDNTLAYLQLAAQRRPSDGELHYRLGLACEKHGDIEFAREFLQEAIRNGDPGVRAKAAAELDTLGHRN